MPNHVHLILTPQDSDGIRRALSKVHRADAGHVHARLKRTGHFWQGRFGCVAMDEDRLGAALYGFDLIHGQIRRPATAGPRAKSSEAKGTEVPARRLRVNSMSQNFVACVVDAVC